MNENVTEEENRVAVRFPAPLVEDIRRLAKEHQRSLNGEIVWAVRRYADHEAGVRVASDKRLPLFSDDRRALQAFIVDKRKAGVSWKDIQAELDNGTKMGYFIYYLKGVAPRAVGGYAPEDFDPDEKEYVNEE